MLVQLADGSVIRVDTLDMEPGPDYFVLVGPGRPERPRRRNANEPAARQPSNQNYSVPADVQLGRPLTVLIWCRPYSVRVAAATLR